MAEYRYGILLYVSINNNVVLEAKCFSKYIKSVLSVNLVTSLRLNRLQMGGKASIKKSLREHSLWFGFLLSLSQQEC